jgi:hypothetical protein
MLASNEPYNGMMLCVTALSLACLAPLARQATGADTNELLQSDDSAASWDRRARVAERAGDVDGALLAWLEALVREDTPARRAEAGRIAEPFERLLATMRLPVPEGDSWEPVLHCSQDGAHVACSASDVLVFEAATGRVVARLSDALARSAPGGDPFTRHPDGTWTHRLEFDPSEPRLAALYPDELLILDYEHGLAHRIDLPLDAYARAVAWRPDGARVAVALHMKGVGDGPGVETVREWDIGTQQWCAGEWILPGEPYGLVYSPDGVHLVAYGFGLHLLRRGAGGSPSSTSVPRLEREGFRAERFIRACAFHPTEPLLAFVAGEYGIATWHLAEGRYVGPLYGMYVTGREELAYDRTGTRLVLGNRLGVRSYDARTGAPLAPPSREDGLEDEWREKYAQSPLSLALDGARFAMAGIADTVRLFDDRSGEPLTPCIRHGAQVVALDMGPGGLLVTASANGVVRTWRLGHEVTASLPPRTACSLEMLSDERHALVAELWTELLIFDRAGRSRSLCIAGELDRTGLLGLSGDGRRVAATFSEGRRRHMVRVIDVATGADVGPPLSLGFAWYWGDAGVPPLDHGGERILVRTLGEAFEYEVASGRCLAARGDDEEWYDTAEEDDWGLILARGSNLLARADAEGNVFVTDTELRRTVRIVGADDDSDFAALGAGWFVEASGSTLRAFDSERGALLFTHECQGEVAPLPRYLVYDQLVVGVKRVTWHVVDLDAVPCDGDLRHVVLARDSLCRLEESPDDPRSRRAIGNIVARARRLFLRPNLAPYELRAEHGGWAFAHLDRLDGAQWTPLVSRRLDPTSLDVRGGYGRLRSDLRQVTSAVNVEGGVDVRVLDFARPGDVSLAGDPLALLGAWRRRLGR